MCPNISTMHQIFRQIRSILVTTAYGIYGIVIPATLSVLFCRTIKDFIFQHILKWEGPTGLFSLWCKLLGVSSQIDGWVPPFLTIAVVVIFMSVVRIRYWRSILKRALLPSKENGDNIYALMLLFALSAKVGAIAEVLLS